MTGLLAKATIEGLFTKDRKDRVEALLAEFGPDRPCSREGYPMLHFLAYKGEKVPWANDLLRACLVPGVNPDAMIPVDWNRREGEPPVRRPFSLEWSPLGTAAKMNNVEGVRLLLAAGAKWDAGTPPAWFMAFEVRTPAIAAAILAAGGAEVAGATTDHHVNVRYAAGKQTWDLQGRIVKEGRVDLLGYLPSVIPADHVFRMGALPVTGRFVLHAMAGAHGTFYASMFKALVDRLPDKRVLGERYSTGFNVYEQLLEGTRKSPALIWLIKKTGVPPLLPTGENILFLPETIITRGLPQETLVCARPDNDTELLRFLVEDKGLSPSSPPGTQQLLHECVLRGALAKVKVLLALGCCPDIPNENGHDALTCANLARDRALGARLVWDTPKHDEMIAFLQAVALRSKVAEGKPPHRPYPSC